MPENSRLSPEAARRAATRWRYFTLDEFRCKHCGEVFMHPGFIQMLDDLRHEFGGPLFITSGYRCPEHNQRVSSTGPAGPHTSGKAADIGIRGGDARRLVGLAVQHGFTGIGVQQKGGGRFIHLDMLDDAPGQPRPWLWSY
jgi:uncharacterized protein YcbK (DUF882 family)